MTGAWRRRLASRWSLTETADAASLWSGSVFSTAGGSDVFSGVSLTVLADRLVVFICMLNMRCARVHDTCGLL